MREARARAGMQAVTAPGLLPLARRLAAVIGMVLFCAGVACDHVEPDINYAPGYGYVVRVVTYEDVLSPATFHEYYAIFPTEEEARRFQDRTHVDPDWFAYYRSLPPEQRAKKPTEKYDRITNLLRPLPPLNEVELLLATPDLQQPIPAIPQ